MTMVTHGQPGWVRRHRGLVLTLLGVLVCVGLSGALLGPWSGVFIRLSLPCRHGDLQVLGYRRGGPVEPLDEGVRFALPRDTAHGWFMGAVGHALPPAVATPGSMLWGRMEGSGVGSPLPVQVVSRESGSRPRLDLVLTVERVNAWLLAAAKRDDAPWVVRLDAGSRVSDAGLMPPAGWDLRLQVTLSGTAARRDGQPGLVRMEAFSGVVDLRWSPGTTDTRVEAQIRLERLHLSDQRGDLAGDVPQVVLDLVAQVVNAGLRAQPPVLPFVVPREAGLAVEVVAGRSTAAF
jgi:hypothetical protein